MPDVTPPKNTDTDLQDQNEYLALLNKMTSAILLSRDYDAIMRTLASHMKEIIKADDCYLIRWDEEKQISIPVTTTAKLDFPFSEVGDTQDLSIIASILEAGRTIAIEDISNTPYINTEAAHKYPRAVGARGGIYSDALINITAQGSERA